MAGLDLTNNTSVYAASDVVQTHPAVPPYTSMHVQTKSALYVATGADPTTGSYYLGANRSCVFHVEPTETLRFVAAVHGETGAIRITAIGSDSTGSESELGGGSLADPYHVLVDGLTVDADTIDLNTTDLEAAINAPQAVAGSNAPKAIAVQGITGGKAVAVSDSTLETSVAAPQATPGSDASKAISIQGVTGGKAVPVSDATLEAAVAAPQAAAGSDASSVFAIQGVTGGKAVSITAALNKTATLSGAKIDNTATSGNTTLVAAVSGQTTRVHRLKLSVAGASIVQIKNGATVLEVFNFAGNGGSVVLDFSAEPWYITSVNAALVINSSTAVQVDGRVEYVTSA